MTIPLITVVSKSGAGKTTLLEKLIPELKRRGYRIATIKHHSHAGFEIDQPSKDSWRHARAGSEHVVIAAPDKIASYRILKRELELDEIAREIKDVDLILVEGYKRAGKPILEVVRGANSLKLVGNPTHRFAVATDVPLEVGVPRFSLDDVVGLSDLIEALFLTHLR